jgi:hypothetical protein
LVTTRFRRRADRSEAWTDPAPAPPAPESLFTRRSRLGLRLLEQMKPELRTFVAVQLDVASELLEVGLTERNGRSAEPTIRIASLSLRPRAASKSHEARYAEGAEFEFSTEMAEGAIHPRA